MLFSETRREKHTKWWRFSLLLLLCSPFLCFPTTLSSSGSTLAVEVSDSSQGNDSLLDVQLKISKTMAAIPRLHTPPLPFLISPSPIPHPPLLLSLFDHIHIPFPIAYLPFFYSLTTTPTPAWGVSPGKASQAPLSHTLCQGAPVTPWRKEPLGKWNLLLLL